MHALDPSHIDASMEAFAQSLRVPKEAGKQLGLTGKKVFTWASDLLGTARLSLFEQKTAIRFELVKAPDWTLEIARFDTFDLGTVASEGSAPTPTATRWGATLWNIEWDSTLSGNTRLGIGQKADWEPKLDQFFPIPKRATETSLHAGVKDFLLNVQDVAHCLDGVKPFSPHLRG